MLGDDPYTGGVRVCLVKDSVVIRIEEDGHKDEVVPNVELTPAKALKMGLVLIGYSWRAATHARRRSVGVEEPQ